MRFNSVIVMPVRSLEVGDIFATETLGQVISGQITGKAYMKSDLTKEQMEYMREHVLTIPDEDYEPLGGDHYYLLFGQFTNHPNHIFLEFDRNVAVFPK